MDIGALTNASAKISSLKPLTFTLQLICAPYKNSSSRSVCRLSLLRGGTANNRRIRVDMTTEQKIYNIYCISKYSNLLVFHGHQVVLQHQQKR